MVIQNDAFSDDVKLSVLRFVVQVRITHIRHSLNLIRNLSSQWLESLARPIAHNLFDYMPREYE